MVHGYVRQNGLEPLNATWCGIFSHFSIRTGLLFQLRTTGADFIYKMPDRAEHPSGSLASQWPLIINWPRLSVKVYQNQNLCDVTFFTCINYPFYIECIFIHDGNIPFVTRTSQSLKTILVNKNFSNCGSCPLFFLFQSSSQTSFFTLKTQPCTIQSSKSLLLQPQLKIVYPKPHYPIVGLSVPEMGESLLR